MSIARTAPERFDFQDLVCIELALRFEQAVGLSILIEQGSGEDALLTLAEPSGPRQFEVQAKDEAASITLNRIAKCMAHFPSRKPEPSLFDRLVDDESLFVILVMSGRCDDTAFRYVVARNWKGQAHPKGRIRRQDARQFLKAFGKVEPEGTDKGTLAANRKRYCQDRSQQIAVDAAKDALSRLLVIEQMSPELLRSECERHLRDHRVPNDQIPDVLLRLRAAAKEAKQTQNDYIPAVNAILRPFQRQSCQPADYVLRGEEDGWRTILVKQNVLLLSGRPRCGKTYAARYIASGYQLLGYEIKETSDVGEASRFLLDPKDRLCIINDPLGANHPAQEPNRVLDDLRGLLGRVGPHARLIVSQNQDRLYEACRQNQLSECDVGVHKWFDLSTPSHEFLAVAWESIAVRRVPTNVIARLSAALRDGSVALELGCLRHLAFNIDRLASPDPSVADLIAKAREDAGDLGRSLANESPEMEELLMALAACSNDDAPFRVSDLAFVLQRDDGDLPGKKQKLARIRRKSDAFPKYATTYKLKATTQRCLDQIERRGFISSAGNALGFTHPYYRSAAETALRRPTSSGGIQALALIRGGLFCLTPRTSRATARNLIWLNSILGDALKAQIVKCAIGGLNSIFPGTRDLCFTFLVFNFEQLTREQQGKLASWAREMVNTSFEHVEWNKGEAWLTSPSVQLKPALKAAESIAPLDALAALDDEEAVTLLPEQAYTLLRFLETVPQNMSVRAALRVFTYDEAMIRARAARIWLSKPRQNDQEVLARLSEDVLPGVAVAALQGAIAGWPSQSEQRKANVLAVLINLAANPAAAPVLLDRLVVFNRPELTGSDPPWVMFGALLPFVLRALPRNSRVQDARLFSSVKSAIQHVDPGDVASICSEWIAWLEREIVERLPGDYELGVTEIVIQRLPAGMKERKACISRLLCLPSSGALISVMRDCVDNWDRLTKDEHASVLSLLNGDRVDRSWLRAACITREVVPDLIQRAILDRKGCLSVSPTRLIDKIDPALLAAAVSVYCGNPDYPFWFLGTHHSGGPFGEIVRALGLQPDHALFELAFHEAVRSMDDGRVQEIVRTAGRPHADRLFAMLLREKVRWNGNWLPQSWATLLEFGEAEVRSRWFDQMVQVLPAIIHDLSELELWLIRKEDQAEIISRVRGDIAGGVLISLLHKMTPEERRNLGTDGVVDLFLEVIFKENAPLLYGTYDRLGMALEKLNIDVGAVSSSIPTLRTAALKRSFDLKDQAKEIRSMPENWIGH